MATGQKLFWLVSLSFFVAGCGGYRTASLPRIGEPGGMEGEIEQDVIEPGDNLRVTMQSGDIFKGDYVSHDTTSLTLVGETIDTINDGSTTTVRHVLPTSNVKTIERYEGEGDDVILVVVGAVVVGVVVAGVVVGSQMNDSFGWGK